MEERDFLPNVSLNFYGRSVALRLVTAGMNGLKYVFYDQGKMEKKHFLPNISLDLAGRNVALRLNLVSHSYVTHTYS